MRFSGFPQFITLSVLYPVQGAVFHQEEGKHDV